MQRVEVQVESEVGRSFRVEQVAGIFDVGLAAKSRRSWSVQLPGLDEAWSIGAIVGPSGSGKTQIAREAYGGGFVESFGWPSDRAVVDAFEPEAMSIKEITGTLSAVGFGTPPSWVLPYGALSNGQRFRCDLARALLSEPEDGVVAFDEFTSVVDRQVAKFASSSVSKAVRKGRCRVKRFVAVTCHYDVLAWLQPDWVLDTASEPALLARGWVQRERKRYGGLVGERPGVRLEVRLGGRAAWPLFKHHHYLSGALHHSSRCYLGWVDDEPVAFCAVIPNMGHKGCRIVHRLVVLPDYQGMGIGLRLLEAVARYESRRSRVSIRTSHPALIRALDARDSWRCSSVKRSAPWQPGVLKGHGVKTGSQGRYTVSFEWMGCGL